ncbi:hypothetical protein AVEN_262633-1 [Araneus ventricosus]|uniref:Integrase catalytic domain-containing protein n=1 Tax=Araneus ventricosus TaxID=182803 RepID=A0A4Y2NX75_ARAVE|nr:hypothetical protein AVEN_262633-1 [Araneus ventricosus]
MEAIAHENITAETIAKTFYENWISRFGVLFWLIADHGSQFNSEVMRNLSRISGVKHQHTTAYHPQCNGKVKRTHRTLKSAHDTIKWSDTLPTILLGLCDSLQEESNSTIAYLL